VFTKEQLKKIKELNGESKEIAKYIKEEMAKPNSKITDDDVIKSDKISGEVLNYLGCLFNENEKFERAFKFFSAAVENGDIQGYLNVADCYMKGKGVEGDLSKAEGSIDGALNIMHNKGINDIKKGVKQHNSEQFFLLICKAEVKLFARYYRRKKYDKALDYFRSSISDYKKRKEDEYANEYDKAQNILVEILNKKLEKYFKRNDEESQNGNTDLISHGWYKISYSLLGFDENDQVEYKYRLKGVEDLKGLNGLIDRELQYIKENFKNSSKELQDILQNRIKVLENIKMLPEEYIKEYFIYKQFQRLLQTEKTFLDTSRTSNKDVKEFAKDLQENRVVKDNKSVYKIDISGRGGDSPLMPSRAVIYAESAVAQCRNQYSFWIHNEKNNGFYDTANKDLHYSNNEEIKRGDALIRYKQGVDQNGNYCMEKIGKYVNIIKILGNIAPDEKKAIALIKLLIKSSCSGKPITFKQLQGINKAIKEEYGEYSYVELVNAIVYHCFAKEIVRRMGESYKSSNALLPLATAQAMALKLIVAGKLSIDKVFNNGALYNFPEHYGDYESQKKRINGVAELYVKEILIKENQAEYDKFMKEHPNGKFSFTFTREALHDLLNDVYGAQDSKDEDYTDGEGYSSDDDIESRKKQFFAKRF
jgi:hypothetical protein